MQVVKPAKREDDKNIARVSKMLRAIHKQFKVQLDYYTAVPEGVRLSYFHTPTLKMLVKVVKEIDEETAHQLEEELDKLPSLFALIIDIQTFTKMRELVEMCEILGSKNMRRDAVLWHINWDVFRVRFSELVHMFRYKLDGVR